MTDIKRMAEDAGFSLVDIHHAFLSDHNEFVEFHQRSTIKYRQAILEALHALKHGNQTWECMRILENVLR